MNETKRKDLKKLLKYNTPGKVQDFLNTIPFNFEKEGETYYSVCRALKEKKAHCFEGALIAYFILAKNGYSPALLDLKVNTKRDSDHVVTLYKVNGLWGAVSKTNHACLRFRDPIYKTVRELALSYFHEYFLNESGEKTLKSFSSAFYINEKKFDYIFAEEDLDALALALDKSPHTLFYDQKQKKYIRKADKIERKAGEITDWSA